MATAAVQVFAGKVVLVTGASSGIGAATALHFAKLGATLALTGRNRDNLNKVSERIVALGQSKPLTVVADLTDETQTTNVMSETLKAFGQLDVLVNNAGVLETGGIENTSLGQLDRMLATNVRSVLHMTMLATAPLVATRGNIVNVSSVNGQRAFPGVLAYCVSKAAVDQLTRCVALDLAPKQVRCNAVCPGVVETELQRRGGLDDAAYAAFLTRSATTHALGRHGQPDEVAAAIAFLAGPSAAFITGATLPVDGGRHAMCPR